MPTGYEHFAQVPAARAAAASAEQAIQDLAERPRRVESQMFSHLPAQVFSAVPKWTDAEPAATVTVENYQPDADFGGAGNPFIFWEMTFEYWLDHASLGGVGGELLIEDSIELPFPPTTVTGILLFSETGGGWVPVRLTNMTAWQAQPGTHVIRPVVGLGQSGNPTGWTLQIRNAVIEAGIL